MTPRAAIVVLACLTFGLATAGNLRAQVGGPPVAVAGSDREVNTGTSVLLDGRASFDPAGQPLTYAWTFAGLPSQSQAVLFGAASPFASFTPDVPGDYFVLLTVSNGSQTGSKAVRIRASGQVAVTRPVAVIRGPRQSPLGDQVVLDASSSTSPSGLPLTFSWRQLFGTPVRLAGDSSPSVSFRSFDPGFATLQLVVADGANSSLPVTATVVFLNQPPLSPAVDAGGDVTGLTGKTVVLLGRVLAPRGPGSVTLRWTYEGGPVAELVVNNRATTAATFVPPVPGFYFFKLTANDGQTQGEDHASVQVSRAAAVPSDTSGGCALSAAGTGGLGWLQWMLPVGWLVWLRRHRTRPATSVR